MIKYNGQIFVKLGKTRGFVRFHLTARSLSAFISQKWLNFECANDITSFKNRVLQLKYFIDRSKVRQFPRNCFNIVYQANNTINPFVAPPQWNGTNNIKRLENLSLFYYIFKMIVTL